MVPQNVEHTISRGAEIVSYAVLFCWHVSNYAVCSSDEIRRITSGIFFVLVGGRPQKCSRTVKVFLLTLLYLTSKNPIKFYKCSHACYYIYHFYLKPFETSNDVGRRSSTRALE